MKDMKDKFGNHIYYTRTITNSLDIPFHNIDKV